MDRNQFEKEVGGFFCDIEKLLNETLVGESVPRGPSIVGGIAQVKKASFTIDKSLVFGKNLSGRLHLRCDYRLRENSHGDKLAVDSSSFKVEFRSTKKFVPIVRFEYDREANNKPQSHFQFHADSVELGLLLARAGKHEAAAQQHRVHFPMGGERYRVCIEDIVEFLIREFAVVPKDNWEKAVSRGRRKFETTQADAVIRHNLELAVEVLRKAGYTVISPYPPHES